MESEIVYTSQVRIERIKGPHRRAFLPALDTPVHFGVHSEVAEHYGVSPEVSEPRPTTLDFVISATAG